MAIVGHDLCHIGDAVQSERITSAHPCHIGLQYAHTRVANLFHNVALQQGADAVDGMQVRLRPKPNLHAFLAGIVAKRLQVLYISVERLGLSVAGTIAVVRQHPAQRHVGSGISVHHRPRRELVVAHVTVQTLANAALHRFLALHIAFAVFEQDAALGIVSYFPIVAVVSIQVAFVESELGQKHGMARQLVIVAKQRRWTVVNHEEDVEIVGIMMDNRLLASEVVAAWGKGVAEHAITSRRPIERSRRAYAAIGPRVGVHDVNLLTAVRETAILHTTTKEIFIAAHRQVQVVAAVLELQRSLAHNVAHIGVLFYREQPGRLVDNHLYAVGSRQQQR